MNQFEVIDYGDSKNNLSLITALLIKKLENLILPKEIFSICSITLQEPPLMGADYSIISVVLRLPTYGISIKAPA